VRAAKRCARPDLELVALIKRNAYHDSVTLMRATAELRRLPGVVEAAALLATEPNRAVLAEAGLLTADAERAGAADLILAVRAETVDAARAALARADALLAPGGAPGVAAELAPRSTFAAARRAEGAQVAVISVPGPFAALEAQQALGAGLHVFLFSDHVALADEVALKRRARARGLFVMGPECGTAILDGVGLGFANRVRRGPIGLVGASGSGLQEISTLVHRLGGGVSQVIGTGARDLDAAVGGLTTLQALAWLARDPATAVIVIVSKPPSEAVADRVLAAAAATGKAVVACLLGWGGKAPPGVRAVATLEAAALAAVAAAGLAPAALPAAPEGGPPVAGRVAGLFTGGTLCEEAAAIVGDGHRFVDFGGPTYTRGRPHPMIDPALRNGAVRAAGSDAGIGVILVDVVLGWGAHPDPAGELARAVAGARAAAGGRALHVVAHVIGTEDDPQRLEEQEAQLRAAGVLVGATNRIAAELARRLAGGTR
jgi:FdrA protein